MCSPCTGIKYLGFIRLSISFCSSLLPCPETCIPAIFLNTTSASYLRRLFILLETAFSFPGIGVAEIITVSPSFIFICLCIFLAILDRAAIGSPCVPVHKITTLLSLSPSTSDNATIIPSGILRYPRLDAISNTFTKLLPSIAILLPYSSAVFIICCNLCTCEAKAATIILPLAFENSCLNASPTLLSDGVNPSTSEFVESESIKSTPCSPI